MLDKIQLAQFRMLYRELTGDFCASDNSQSKQCDERWQKIIRHLEAGMLRDFRVSNGRSPKYDKFWDLMSQKLEEMQAVDYRWHSHSNKVAISAPDMHKM